MPRRQRAHRYRVRPQETNPNRLESFKNVDNSPTPRIGRPDKVVICVLRSSLLQLNVQLDSAQSPPRYSFDYVTVSAYCWGSTKRCESNGTSNSALETWTSSTASSP